MHRTFYPFIVIFNAEGHPQHETVYPDDSQRLSRIPKSIFICWRYEQDTSRIEVNISKVLTLKIQVAKKKKKKWGKLFRIWPPSNQKEPNQHLRSRRALNKPRQTGLIDSSVISRSSAWFLIDAFPHTRSSLSKHSGLSYLLFIHPLKPCPHTGLVYW